LSLCSLEISSQQGNKYFGWFFVVWWLPATCCFTFNGPFVAVGNGYFASWACLLAALGHLREVAASDLLRFEALLEQGSTAPIETHIKHCLFLASIVVLWAAGALCDESNYCEKEYGWAVACGAVSSFICLLLHIPGLGALLSAADRPIAAFMALWWGFGVAIMTFKGPFLAASNGFFRPHIPPHCKALLTPTPTAGFFGAWGGLISAAALARYEFAEELQQFSGGAGAASAPAGGIISDYQVYSPPKARDSEVRNYAPAEPPPVYRPPQNAA